MFFLLQKQSVFFFCYFKAPKKKSYFQTKKNGNFYFLFLQKVKFFFLIAILRTLHTNVKEGLSKKVQSCQMLCDGVNPFGEIKSKLNKKKKQKRKETNKRTHENTQTAHIFSKQKQN